METLKEKIISSETYKIVPFQTIKEINFSSFLRYLKCIQINYKNHFYKSLMEKLIRSNIVLMLGYHGRRNV